MRVLLHVIRKEFLQLARDRKMIPLVLLFPVIQLIVFGYAATLDLERIPLLLVDLDHTAASRRLTERFLASRYFEFVGSLPDVAAVEPWLVRGRATIALVIGEGFGGDRAARRTAEVQLIADGSDANSASIAMSYASQILAAENARVRPARPAGGVELVPRVWYNPEMKSRWFYVPAILAMVLMVMTMILPSMAVVREKEIGTLEQIIVTPVRSWQLIVGKLAPFALIGLVDLLLVVGLTVWHFGVPLRGSLAVLVLISIPFLVTLLGLGLLVSTVVRNQQQAMMTSMFLLMVPFIYLSGLVFPIENMPRAIQWSTYWIPLRYYNNVIRGVLLKGSGLEVLWPEALVLCAMSVVAITLASLRFRKRLD
ncbi:MAG: ABC transporter permease [Acidobacteria bacterium]|nr:ABC transporter permease [Acidobacteriota bacterium]